MKYTTLNKIRACGPCENGWGKLLKHLGKTRADDEPLPFEVILDSNGLDDAIWCCRASPEYDREWRLFAVWCVRQVQHLNPDPRIEKTLQTAEDFANGLASQQQLDHAEATAWAAGDAGDAAWAAARATAWAAGDAAGDAAWAAAGDAARATAWAAAWDARATAWAATGDAAWAAARDVQKEVFRWVVNGGLTKFERGE